MNKNEQQKNLKINKIFKLNFAANSKDKWIDTERGLDLFENLINEHNDYMKWLMGKKLISDEDLVKHYSALGCYSIRSRNLNFIVSKCVFLRFFFSKKIAYFEFAQNCTQTK